MRRWPTNCRATVYPLRRSVSSGLLSRVLSDDSTAEIPIGVPGSQKASAVVKRGQRLSAATYLKGPSVFGFNGVYKPFAIDAAIVGTDLGPARVAPTCPCLGA